MIQLFADMGAGRDVECSRTSMKDLSTANIDLVDIWTTRDAHDKPTNPKAFPETFSDVSQWLKYKCAPCQHLAAPSTCTNFAWCTLVFCAEEEGCNHHAE